MKGHTEAVGIERREFALNGDGVGWMGLLKNEYFARWGRRSRDVSSESRSHKNLVAPPRSQYAPVEREAGSERHWHRGVKTRGEPSVKFDGDRSKRWTPALFGLDWSRGRRWFLGQQIECHSYGTDQEFSW